MGNELACSSILIENIAQKRSRMNKEPTSNKVWIKDLLFCLTRNVIILKRNMAIKMSFLKFTRILWERTKPTVSFVVSKSVTRFFY